MNIIQEIEKEQVAAIVGDRTIPDFAPGDTGRVNVKVTEGTRTRIQAYEGVCIARSGGGLNENFTVRKISYGEGVERVFPMYSPVVDSIEEVRRGGVYHLHGFGSPRRTTTPYFDQFHRRLLTPVLSRRSFLKTVGLSAI